MKKEKWILMTKKAEFQALADKFKISPVLARLMVNRGIDTEKKIEKYLHGTLNDLYNPWDLKDMKKAVELLLKIKAEGGKVAIASDFDCDGIFAGFLLKKALEKLEIPAEIYTPERIAEGYGLNRRIIDEAKEKNASLILTCDNGIAATEEIKYAKEQGLFVIVTDHHEPQEVLPQADAIVDPKQEDETYPFNGLCGAGVAYKLVQALFEACGRKQEETEEYLQYVAIATVADVMDLVDENRILVKEGLKRLTQTKNAGIRALIRGQNLSGKAIRTYHIGFVLGPCFNASGRLKTVEMAFELLEEQEEKRAELLAEELIQLNNQRKEMTENEAARAVRLLEEDGEKTNEKKVLTVYLPECHESIIGIVAGRLKEKYHKPVLVFTDAGEGLLKASGRSIETYNMFEELLACKKWMTRFGGHKMAAGLTMKKENLEVLDRELNVNSKLEPEDFIPVVNIDIALPLSYISDPLLEELDRLEPLGKGNTKPIFAEQHFRILRADKRGREGQVLVMNVENREGTRMDALLFGETTEFEDFIAKEYGACKVEEMYQGRANDLDVAFTYYPSVNEYQGLRNFQITVGSYCRIQ